MSSRMFGSPNPSDPPFSSSSMSSRRYASPTPSLTFQSNSMQARSPTLYNETSTDENSIYQIAMKKVYEASWKFDRGKNGEFLKVLNFLISLLFKIY